MKLKLVVASMSILGLVSCPVLAAHQTKTKHHHKVMKRQVATQDYKDTGAIMKDEAVCVIPASAIFMTHLTQNVGRSIPNPCMSADWFKRIQVSGGINLDIGKWGNRNLGYMGENYQRFSLNDVYINIAADVNDWTKAFASISYSNPTTLADNNSAVVGGDFGEYSAAYANNIQGTKVNNVQLEQALITISNFDVSPIFLQMGKGFQDFSRYEIHPITRTFTQVMSETLATSIKLGFAVPMGIHGDVYVFDDPTAKVGQTASTTNYGASLGYGMVNDQLGFDLGVGYLYNLYAVNDIAYAVNNYTSNLGYNKRASGLAAYADVNSGPFFVSARYTTALQRFSGADLPQYGTFALSGGTATVAGNGAKPWSAGIRAGYGFMDLFGMMGYGMKQNLYVGYDTSRQAASLDLPETRWTLGYNIDVWTHTNFGVEWNHDIAYSLAHGGSNNNTNLVSLRAAVEFG